MKIVDLFAGPGGWDLAARSLNLDPVGIEYDADACATRAAAGLLTVRADLAHYPPPPVELDGLIASPPCQAFSAAGKREAVDHVEHLASAIGRGAWDDRPPTDDPNVWLVLEVGRWIETARPRWVALEQVPAVLPLWETLARRLRHHHGYGTWTGVLNAADYGVPQTRRRAILLAHLDRQPNPPEPTHAKDPTPSLFGEALPWVTMAEALGIPVDGEINTGRDWKAGGTRDDAQRISADSPASSIDGKGRWHLHIAGGDGYRTLRHLDQPAATLAFGQNLPKWVRDRPATTIAGDPRVWPPGHKINADDIARLGEAEAKARYGDRAGTEAVRVPIEAALALQTFPESHPLVGSLTSQFRQVGNAVPPLLAEAILRQLV